MDHETIGFILMNIALLLASLVLAIALWLKYRDKMYLYTTYFWISYALVFVLQGAFAFDTNLLIASFGFANLELYFLFFITSVTLEQSIPIKKITLVNGLGYLVTLLLLPTKLETWVKAIPLCSTMGFSALGVAVYLLMRGKQLTVEKKLFLACLAFQGLHVLDFPWLRFYDPDLIIGFSISFFLAVIQSVLIPLITTERIQKGLASDLENQVSLKTLQLVETLEENRGLLRLLSSDLKKAETSAEHRGRMLQVISHDIVNSLNVARNYAELFLLNGDRSLIEKVAWALNDINGITKYATVSQKLELEKPPQREPIKLAEIFEHLRMLFQIPARDKRVRLDFRLEPSHLIIYAEKITLTSEILGNLISNAIKYSNPGGVVTVAGRKVERDVELMVTDEGIGMPEHIIAKADNPATNMSRLGTSGESGNGYGLPLVFAFVKSYGGMIDIKSTPISTKDDHSNHGTTVTLRFPGPPVDLS